MVCWFGPGVRGGRRGGMVGPFGSWPFGLRAVGVLDSFVL